LSKREFFVHAFKLITTIGATLALVSVISAMKTTDEST
jgi:hypothetical protein